MHSFLKWLAAAALALLPLSAQQAPLYKDPAAPIEKRVDDLISRLTLEEKVSQLMSDSPAINRLDIPTYNWWNESLHGVARAGRATVFPQAIALAATWNPALMSRIATTISDEARAKYHEFARRGKRNIYQGLTFWTPNINLFRDPRWGRGMETYGEDPYLTSRMAVAFIKAMQGDDPKYLKTVATAKHYAIHSGPESLRHTFDAIVSEHDLQQTYLPHFEAAIREAGALSVMCAYNSVAGQPACANTRLLGDILRKQWSFSGYIVSDCGAIEDIYKKHKFSPTGPEGVAKAIKAGTDLNCGVEYENALPAVRSGLLSEADIDQALRRLFYARFKLGLFDPPEMVKYAQIPYNVNDSPAHAELALQAARESIVLLKNDQHTLPLSKSLKTIAVIGPNAADADVLLGNYNGIPSAPVTLLDGIRRKVEPATRVLYAPGTELAANMPAFESVPSTALFTSNAADRQPGLKGEYFTSGNFDGRAHRPRELTVPTSGRFTGEIPTNPQPLFTRIDPQASFQWWDAAPRQDMNDDDFGVRWTGYITPPITGTYRLGAAGLNAFEFYLEGKQIARFNSIHGHKSYEYSTVELEAGKLYQIRLDFHHYLNDAEIQLVWSRAGAIRQQDAIDIARQADTIILALGLSPRLEGEEMRVPVEGFEAGDRLQIGLPRVQEELLEQITALGKPVVLVLMNGSSVAINSARDRVPAIIDAWYPGQAGGTAIADVLFGDYNPGGRLPVTFYKSVDQLPPFTNYDMKGKTYRFFEGEPLFPFGFGLSYTTFAYRKLSLPRRARVGEPVKLSFEVENAGDKEGDEVVQLYLTPPRSFNDPIIHSLEAFERVHLQPKERKTIHMTLLPRQLEQITANGQRVAAPGTFHIAIGGHQPTKQKSAGLTAALRLQK